ncbi:hypothetical protein T4D_3178 [Trichinella pseudospiralis]|uniref:Uncharacterized protein n=1 Tax=Trichinella pseudospiralis TaxID=6337 RepID=A0A0V1FGY0_TRIPS|nr:hypothetical protein T4D_3178 [Trichinella pseudospiralis]
MHILLALHSLGHFDQMLMIEQRHFAVNIQRSHLPSSLFKVRMNEAQKSQESKQQETRLCYVLRYALKCYYSNLSLQRCCGDLIVENLLDALLISN